MTEQYGKTWWGKLWLNALIGIDYTNRLPRGRRYASDGSVLELVVGSAEAQARVQGRRRQPYQVTVSLCPFSAEEQQEILESVGRSPLTLGGLANRELPTQMYALAESSGVNLLPDSWQQMDASCSCPDWAVPCKHIAAVIYLLANEIDRNPFLIFQLHGMDLVKELEKREKIGLGEIGAPPRFPLEAVEKPVEFTDSDKLPDAEDLLGIDLSQISPLGGRIFDVLATKPLFHDRDFHKLLSIHYKRTAVVAKRYHEDPKRTEASVIGAHQFLDTCVRVGQMGEFLFAKCSPFNEAVNEAVTLFGDWIERLSRVRPATRANYGTDEYRATYWHVLYRFAVKLVMQQAYVPAIATDKFGAYMIHWHPATLDTTVQGILDRLTALCPENLVSYHEWEVEDRQAGERMLDRQSQVRIGFNLICKYFTSLAYETYSAGREDLMCEFFFQTCTATFDHFEVQEYPRVIHRWLNSLTLRERRHRILMLVEIDDSGAVDIESVTDDLSIRINLSVEVDRQVCSIQKFCTLHSDHPRYAEVLGDISFLSNWFPDIETMLAEAAEHPEEGIHYTLSEFAPVLLENFPILNMLGVGLMLPKSLQNLIHPKASLRVSATGERPKSFFSLEDMFSFDWRVAIGDTTVSAAVFKRLVAQYSGLVRIKNHFVLVDDSDVKAVLRNIEGPTEGLGSLDILRMALTEEINDASVEIDRSAEQLLNGLFDRKSVPVPDMIHATLRDYQKRGFEWLVHNAKLGFGSVLADDMGLGKTLQVIALMAHFKSCGELGGDSIALVIVPFSLLTNWRREIERFAPDLSVGIYHGPSRNLKAMNEDVVLTSYGVSRSDADQIRRRGCKIVVIDEAQNIKNPGTKQTAAVKKIRAPIKVALTGTPVENRLMDCWSIFDFAMRGLLGTQKRFYQTLAKPIENERDSKCIERFRKLTRPFLMRRLKSDKSIVSDLPDKIRSDRFCSLTPEQASLYQDTVDRLMKVIESAEEDERRGIIFKLISALKQICNAPSHYLSREEAESNESGKLSLLLEIMAEALEAEEKVLIFTQFKVMGELLVKSLHKELGLNVRLFHGGLSGKARDELVQQFQESGRERAMVLSLKAGGTGLNLTEANQVVHYDLWWNPAVEDQATDRVHRIGQSKNVLVHRLITEKTFEERINKMISEKRELADLAVVPDEKAITEMSNGEIREFLELKV